MIRPLSLIFFLLLTGPPVIADDSLPPVPEGYSNETLVQAAIATGFLELIELDGLAVPEGIEVLEGIEYGRVGDRALHLDLYLPKERERPTAAIVFIHGGAWKSGSRDDLALYCIEFAKRGYVTATISYRLSGEAPFPAAVQDAKCALRWVRSNADAHDIDPERIAVSGNSAGGHLALMVGYSEDETLEGDCGNPDVPSRVKAVVNFYGPTDLTTDFAAAQGVLHEFMDGRTLHEARDDYERGSPIRHLDGNDPPTLTFHGTIDSVVPVAQADLLDARLNELGVEHVYERYDGWPHAMDVARVVNERCVAVMARFFERHLR